ncbi:MAG: methyltransferase domain-containing protein, partial [Candidatus Hydrothermarchaeales archaeon]
MKHELLGLLVCPICQCEFELRESLREKEEILEGGLTCRRCDKEFPITGGVPRVVTDIEEKSTAKRFGYEWKKFPELSSAYERQFLDWISPIDRDFFEGKMVLDAGCGKGRHVYLASHFGAKMVVGMDVSEAIRVAYANTKDLPNVHLIQADIYHPPLKKAFDYIYSIGVLHHLSKPEDGFRALRGLLKPGGTISIWVYGREGNGWIVHFVNPLRRFLTSKMPLSILQMMSFPMAFSLYA